MQQICSQEVTSTGNPRGYNNNHTTIRVEDQNPNEIHQSVIGPSLCRRGYQRGMGRENRNTKGYLHQEELPMG